MYKDNNIIHNFLLGGGGCQCCSEFFLPNVHIYIYLYFYINNVINIIFIKAKY